MWKKRAIILGFLAYFASFWFIFSGVFTLLFAFFCLISVLFSFYLDKKFFLHRDECLIFPSFSFLKYILVIINDIFYSSLYVIKTIIQTRGNIPDPEISIITLKIKNQHVRSFIENSITLTPGTYVIDSNGENVLASAIDKESMDDLVNRKFISKIYKIFKKFNFD